MPELASGLNHGAGTPLTVLQKVLRMAIRSAVDTGIDHAARQGKPEAEMTPDERATAKRARDLAGRAKQVARVTRRFWR